jgi:hypothetical protein
MGGQILANYRQPTHMPARLSIVGVHNADMGGISR